MFFYREIEQNGSLTLTLNLENFTFSDTLLNTQTTGTFIITADGTGAETITITDDSGEVTISPSSFTLNGGESQTVTLLFTPTTTGSKSGTVTVVGSGGNNSTLPVTGSGFLFEEAAYFEGGLPVMTNQSKKSAHLNASGNKLAIAGWELDETGGPYAGFGGIITIYSKISGSWVKEQILNADHQLESFGSSVSINASGDKIVVGSPENMSTYEVLPPGSSVKYYFELDDIYRDGWQGATMQVRQGNTVIATLGETYTTNDGTATVHEAVSLIVGQTYNLYFNNSISPGYDNEMRINIYDSNYNRIFSDRPRYSSPPYVSPYTEGDTIHTWIADGKKYFGGLAHIFISGSTGWIKQQELKTSASDSDPMDYFGDTVAISSDGNTIVVAAPQDENSDRLPIYNQGRVFVYKNLNNFWVQQQILSMPSSFLINFTDGSGKVFLDESGRPAFINTYFGKTVSINATGNRIAVNAYGSNNDNTTIGYVIIFSSGSAGWTQEHILTSEDMSEFGSAIAMDESGNKLVVGSPYENRADIFVSGNTGWVLEKTLTGSLVNSSWEFGNSVAINSAGNIVIVGAEGDERADQDSYKDEGLAYVFVSGSDGWAEIQILMGSFAKDYNDRFGNSVTIDSSGETIVVVADVDEKNTTLSNSGLTYLFTLNEEINGFKYVNSTSKLAAFNNSGLTSISGEFFIKGDMPSQTEFSNLDTVNGNIYIGQSSVEQLAIPNLTYVSESLTISDNSGLTTVQLPSLENIGGDLIITDAAALLTVELPLDSVGGDIRLSNNESLQTVNLGSASVGGDITIESNLGLQTLELTELQSIAGDLNITSNDSLQTVILENSDVGGDLVIINNSGLTVVELANIQVETNLNISDNSALTTIELPANIGGDLTLNNNTALETVQFSGSSITGSITISYNSLLQTLDLSNVISIGGSIMITDNSGLTTLNLTNLQNVIGNLIITDNDSISTLDLTNLVSVSGDLIINYPSGANVIIPPTVIVGGTNQVAVKP